MNIRLIKKSIIMVPCIILVAAAMAFGADHREGEGSILNQHIEIVRAFLQGGSGNTIAGPGFSILNAEAQTIICADTYLPAMSLTVVNLGVGSIRLMNMMDMRTPDDTQGDNWMIGPDQTKAFFVPAGQNGAFMGLIQIDGGGEHGLALWSAKAYPTIPNKPFGRNLKSVIKGR